MCENKPLNRKSPKNTRKTCARMPVGAFSRCVPWGRYPLYLFASDQYPFDLIEAHLVAPPVIELRRPGAGMVGHGRGLLQRPAVLEIGRDAGRPETVVADLGLDPGRLGAPANHLVGVGLGQGTAGELARAAADGAKERPLEVCRKPDPVQIGREDLFKVVVAGHGVILATLLMEPYPEPSVLS